MPTVGAIAFTGYGTDLCGMPNVLPLASRSTWDHPSNWRSTMRQNGLLQDIGIYSEWISKALKSSGYLADFTVLSVREIERFLTDSTVRGKATPDGLLAEDTAGRIFALGAYIGEVIRRSFGGNWKVDDEDSAGELNIYPELPDGTTLWPVRKVINRFQSGPEESLVAYVASVG